MPEIEQARAWYPPSDPVHGFDHVLRVYRIAERLSQAEDADTQIVQAAVLLHDAQAPDQARSDHHLASAEFARQILKGEDWPEERIMAVQHCIRSHRFRDVSEQPQTLEAQILFDADKLDAIGATGVARAIAYAALAGQPAYVQPSQQFMETGQAAPGEPHSAYHEYLFKLRVLKDRLYTPSGRILAVERHRFLSEFYERLAAEARGEL